MTDAVIGQITEEAHEIITTKRDSHGDSYSNHRQIANLWSAFIEDYEFEPWEVAIMMTMLKASRMQSGALVKDHFRDIAGYADCGWDAAVRHPETDIAEDVEDDRECPWCDGSGVVSVPTESGVRDECCACCNGTGVNDAA